MSVQAFKSSNYVSSPIWRASAFCGQFADPFIRDTELEGGNTADAFDYIVSILNDVIDSEVLNTTAPLACGAEDLERHARKKSVLRQCALLLTQSAATDRKVKRVKGIKSSLKWIANFRLGLLEMQSGEMMLCPGGWRRRNGGHACLYLFTRRQNHFDFVLCNTGMLIFIFQCCNFHQAGRRWHKLPPSFYSRLPEEQSSLRNLLA